MIKNQKQVKLTEDKLAELKAGQAEFIKNKSNYTSLEFELGNNSFVAFIEKLEAELQEYKMLLDGNFHCLQADSLQNIPEVLIKARLAQKISQKELADRLGKKEQQIQRYEITDYETASWVRIMEVADALNLKFNFQKVIIIQSSKEDFDYGETITAEQITEADLAFKKNLSLILQ